MKSEITERPLEIFSDDDKNSISYFFMRLQNVYGSTKMRVQWPDLDDLKMARREFGRMIAGFSRDQINDAFDMVHKQRRSGNDRFDWPNIDAVIGLLTNEGVFTGSSGTLAHRIFEPERLLNNGTKAERKKRAICELSKLKGMFL